MTPFITQTYLIGALYQSVELIHHIATTGKCSYQDYKHILMALQVKQFSSIADTFGAETHLQSGLHACEKYYAMRLGAHDTNAITQINRYFAELFKLESNLRKKPKVMEKIAQRVNSIEDVFHAIDTNMEKIIKQCATIYAEEVSPNTPRILIRGTENHLKNLFNAQKVRTLLLSGLRITLLWREVGGKQWHLLIKRKKIIETCQHLKSQITATNHKYE